MPENYLRRTFFETDYEDAFFASGRSLPRYSIIGNWGTDFLGLMYANAAEARARALDPQDLTRWEDDGGPVAPDDGKPYTNYVAPVMLATRQQRRAAERNARKGHLIPRR